MRLGLGYNADDYMRLYRNGLFPWSQQHKRRQFQRRQAFLQSVHLIHVVPRKKMTPVSEGGKKKVCDWKSGSEQDLGISRGSNPKASDYEPLPTRLKRRTNNR
jgi:hypothetical protein